MNDLDRALIEAWERVEPMLREDGEELGRRLERRRSRTFGRPLRTDCVAVRANDQRLDDMHATIWPRHAISLEADSHRGRYVEHRLELTRGLLERICVPVEIARPGEPADEVARRLGCRPRSLFGLRRTGFFGVNLKPGLRGRHGPPVPLIYTQRVLDPQFGGLGVDDVFGGSWRHNVERLTEGFCQWLTRVPRYTRIEGRDVFQGWLWVCPRCGKAKRTVYCPTEWMDLPTWLGFAPAKDTPKERHKARFACGRCLRLVHFSRASLTLSWNLLILHLSGGLLYGREVRRPAWLTKGRKREYRPRRAQRAPGQEAVERLLVETDLLYREIAAKVGMVVGNVGSKARLIFRRRQVKNRAELKALLRPRAARRVG